MRSGRCYTGNCEWLRSRTGEVVSRIHYSIELLCNPLVQIHYGPQKRGVMRLQRGCGLHMSELWRSAVVVSLPGGAVRACRRRVRKLYLAPGRGYFACRQCCDLCYRSQREDDWTRALSKAQAIRVRLGGSAGISPSFPPKPKRMRWKTYRLLRARSEGLWVESLSGVLGRSAPALGDDTSFGDCSQAVM
jgi:hypothetical protein